MENSDLLHLVSGKSRIIVVLSRSVPPSDLNRVRDLFCHRRKFQVGRSVVIDNSIDMIDCLTSRYLPVKVLPHESMCLYITPPSSIHRPKFEVSISGPMLSPSGRTGVEIFAVVISNTNAPDATSLIDLDLLVIDQPDQVTLCT